MVYQIAPTPFDPMNVANTQGTSFIRCIKPNSVMREGVFEGNQVLNQLQCSGGCLRVSIQRSEKPEVVKEMSYWSSSFKHLSNTDVLSEYVKLLR